MSSSYNRNIDRLRSTERAAAQQSMSQRTQMASTMGQRSINEANRIKDELSDFSKTLKEMREKDIEEKQEKGRLEAINASEVNAQKLLELKNELSTLTETDTRYHEIKAEMLKMSGPDIYPDADRIAHLSPWAQVGYAKEKLRVFNDTFPDKLEHAMANSDKALTLDGITFTPKELHDNNIYGLPFKEAAMHLVAEDIKKSAGLDKFSPELLELAGTYDAIQKAKEANTAEYRQRYNIDSSSITRSQAQLTWQTSEKTGEDLYHFLVKTGATVDKDNNILGNTGAWEALESIIISEGIAQSNPDYAFEILNQPMPDALAKQVGAEKGTTFAEHWPNRVSNLKQKIREGYSKQVENELKLLETAGKELEIEFIQEARNGNLTTDQVNDYKRKFAEQGLTIPSSVTNYETASDRTEREDTEALEALIASQNGYISHEQLDSYHPKAALPYRDKASQFEKEAVEAFDSEAKIKAYLDTTWESMGIKGNEKSIAYVEAFSNAKLDYARKYHNYVAMGYEPAVASHLALHAESVTDPRTGEVIPDSMGVLKEIETNTTNNKYIVEGQSVEKDLKPNDIRVVQIKMAKEEILNDPSSVIKHVIGGDYGHRQINTIQQNLEKYGPKGLYMDKSALEYYKGIARGRNPREGGWWGLVDAQLKANGYINGLNESRPSSIDLITGTDVNGFTIPNDRGTHKIDNSIARSMSYPSLETSIYAKTLLEDSIRQGVGLSLWDTPEYLNFWLKPNTIENLTEEERKALRKRLNQLGVK